MRKNVFAAASLLALGTALVPAAAGAEENPGLEVSWVGDNVVVSADRAEATVLAKFRCFGGEEGTHLWVSFKQDGENLEGEGSGARARAHYDTNYMWAEVEGGQTINCNGQWHTTKYTVKQVPGKGTLDRGAAWVQFCAFDTLGNMASVNGWKTVRVGR